MAKTKTPAITAEDIIGEPVERDKVILWRKRQLVYGGFSMANAEKIANATTVDYQYAIDMLKNSGDEELTVRIVL